MWLFDRLVHWWRMEFYNGCLDPHCPGTLVPYDNNVGNDTCYTCERTWNMIEADLKQQREELGR